MAPLPVIGNCVRCALGWSNEGGVAPINVMHVITSSGNEDEIANAIADAMSTNPTMFNTLFANYTLETITVTLLDGTSAGVPIAVGGYNINGGAAGNMVPQVAGVLSLHTPQRGPRGRGRLYLGPTGETVIDGGFLTGDTAADCVLGWQGFEGDLASGDISGSLGVASYVHSEVNGVSSITMRTQTGTMRRRQNQLV